MSQSISISLCRHAAQEYIRRQLEEEQRQLEILQQQLLQEQALLLVTVALPPAILPPICAACPPPPSRSTACTSGSCAEGVPDVHSPQFSGKRDAETTVSCLSVILVLRIPIMSACTVPLIWLDLKGFPGGCGKTVLSAPIVFAHTKRQHPRENRTFLFSAEFLGEPQSCVGGQFCVLIRTKEFKI